MRRILVCSFVFTLAAASLPSPAGGVADFGDVDAGRFYTAAVQWMVDEDVTTGTSPTCFSPDDFVTRGQAAAFMWRMEGFPAPGPAHPFSDVSKVWQQDPISWMSNNDITTGTSATTFSPEDVLTRGQMAALLFRLEGNPAGSPHHPFVDVVKDWQQDPISWMADQGITTGTSPIMFSPDDTVTRGQLAAFFYRYKGSPAVEIDPSSPVCPNFSGPISPHTGISGSVGFELSPSGDDIMGFILFLELDQYLCPGTGVTITQTGSGGASLFDPDESFVGTSFAFFGSTQDWTGTITGDTAAGTVAGAFPLGIGGDTCEWGPVDWTATRS